MPMVYEEEKKIETKSFVVEKMLINANTISKNAGACLLFN